MGSLPHDSPGGDGLRDFVGGFESLQLPVHGDHLLRAAAGGAVACVVGGSGRLGERDRSERVEQGEERGGVGAGVLRSS